MNEVKKNSILIVDDANTNIMALTQMLSSDYTIYAAKNGHAAISAAVKHLPDLILLDIIMPEMDGHEVIAELKASEMTKNIPVIFITGLNDSDDEEKGLALGAADYIGKPFKAGIVKLRIKNQITMINQLRTIEMLSMIDKLTSIPNRRGFDSRMDMEWSRAVRESECISIMMMDVDKFKVYNDTYGHQQGDVVLQTIAKTIKDSLNRPGDYAARWGGEEFMVLLPNTSIDAAKQIAEQIRLNVSGLLIPCADGTETRVTISIGLHALTPNQDSSLEEAISETDKLLYKAKESGRNCVISSDS